jgi:hypothetical protein
MNSLIIAALLGYGAQSEPTITYTCPGKNAKAVFEDLSRQAGQTLLIGQSLAEEPIILRLDKANLSDVKEKLAFALNGDWVPETSGLRLIQKKTKPVPAENPQGKVIAERQKVVREELATTPVFDTKAANTLALQIEDYLKIQGEKPDDDSRYRNDTTGPKLGDQGPYAKFCRRIFVLMQPKELASVSENKRVVWSTQPTKMQRALPKEVWSEWTRFQRDLEVWNQAIGNRLFNADMSKGVLSTIHQLIKTNIGSVPHNSVEPSQVTKILLIGKSYGSELDQIEIRAVDKNGIYVLKCMMPVNRFGMSSDARSRFDSIPATNEFVEIGQDAFEFWKLSQERQQFGYGPEVTRELHQPSKVQESKLLRPESYDPISLIAGEALVRFAIRKGLQLAVVPNDSWVSRIGLNENGAFDLSAIGNMLKLTQCELLNDPKWLAGRTIHGNEGVVLGTFSNRLNRRNFGVFLRESNQFKRVTIETGAKYAASAPFSDIRLTNRIAQFSKSLLNIDDTIMRGSSNNAALWIFGSLPITSQAPVSQGIPIPFRQLSAAQQDVIRTLVFFDDNTQIQYDPKMSAARLKAGIEFGNYYNSIEGEPTERYGNDIDPNATITIKITDSIVLRAFGPPEREYHSDMDINSMANWLRYRKMTEDSGKTPDAYSNYILFSAVEQRKLSIRVQLDEDTYLICGATETKSRSPKVDSIDKLPPAIAKEINDQLQRLSKPPPPPSRLQP